MIKCAFVNGNGSIRSGFYHIDEHDGYFIYFSPIETEPVGADVPMMSTDFVEIS